AVLEQALALTALEQSLGLSEVVDAERSYATVVATREERAGPRIGEQLVGDAIGGAHVDRLDAALDRLSYRDQERPPVTQARPLGLSLPEQGVEHVLVHERERRTARREQAAAGVEKHQLRDAELGGERHHGPRELALPVGRAR